ncbi:hypothetical protein [Pedobacter sp. KLB.chiD]|uniref:glycoside hydrolase family 16 protein n=1 Tax=Pedobacter sp. KLB.chiD TaxID=3387402 RepID=UPI00399AE21A
MKTQSKKHLFFACFAFAIYGGCKKSTNPPEPLPTKTEANAQVATLTTSEFISITTTSAIGGGTIINKGSSAVTDQGICWSLKSGPTTTDNKTGIKSITGSGIFTSDLSNLKPSTKYYVRAFAVNNAGTSYGNEVSFTTKDVKKPVIVLDSSSFDTQAKYEAAWNMFYPWGTDHNGTARMYKEQVTLQSEGVLQITADKFETGEKNSTADPYLKISYHSGAIHLKEKITVTNDRPVWVISGDFQVPTNTGTWPAFWITGVDNWPPESDIMEFKGSNVNWQNTITGPNWQNVSWQTKQSSVSNPQNWHNYKLIMERIDDTNLSLTYYIDNVKTISNIANFTDKRFWLIVNMQMGGSSGTTDASLKQAVMKARNVYVAYYNKD